MIFAQPLRDNKSPNLIIHIYVSYLAWANLTDESKCDEALTRAHAPSISGLSEETRVPCVCLPVHTGEKCLTFHLLDTREERKRQQSENLLLRSLWIVKSIIYGKNFKS